MAFNYHLYYFTTLLSQRLFLMNLLTMIPVCEFVKYFMGFQMFLKTLLLFYNFYLNWKMEEVMCYIDGVNES